VTAAASKHGIPPSTLGRWWVAKGNRRSAKKAKPSAERKVSARILTGGGHESWDRKRSRRRSESPGRVSRQRLTT